MENIKYFFENGKYNSTGKIFETCNYKNGLDFDQELQIGQINECPSNKFLIKKIISQTPQTNTTSISYFYKNGKYIYATSNDSSNEGYYTINKNILKIYSLGFIQPIGKIAKRKTIYIKTDNGFLNYLYYRKNHQWIKYGVTNITKLQL